MAAEVLHYLDPQPGEVIVDGTLGTGGHSLFILPRILPDGRVIGLDRDASVLSLAQQRLREFEPNVTVLHGNYRDLPDLLASAGVGPVNGVLLDLGMSSLQVDAAARGFSFSKEGPLDMRMDVEQETTAEDLVNTLRADELAMLLESFGEERFARRIAQRIVQARRQQRLTTTAELARVGAGAAPPAARHGRLHPATRTFQALRIAVNAELDALRALLARLEALLAPGGRAVVLTYHSLEDRLVKQTLAEGRRNGLWTLLTKKPARPTDEEIARNPRARSAKLRALRRSP